MSRRMITRTLAPGAILLASFAAVGCGGSSSSGSSVATTSSSAQAPSAGTSHSASGGAAPAPAASGKVVAVSIANYAYKPVSLTVKVGTKLTFSNRDSTAHTATSTSPPLDSGSIAPGASASVTVSKPGTYHYICQFHPFMHGTIIATS